MLGLTRTLGQWLTLDGKQPSFTNWNLLQGEPNGGSRQNYAFAYSKSNQEKYGPSYPAGTWNNVDSIFYPGKKYLCTYEPSVP